jgi:hypothetical protein
MDRAAKLTAEARFCLYEEKWDFPKGWTQEERRADTRAHLANYAAKIGLPDLEISAAVDEALTEAGTTP